MRNPALLFVALLALAGCQPTGDSALAFADTAADSGGADCVPADARIWYPDADADGFGALDALSACTQPAGHVAVTGDCDDTNAAISPDAPEHCDGVDEDCDGQTDEDAVDQVVAYADTDRDAHGDAATGLLMCVVPDGLTELGDDCDDTDPTISPDEPEYCDGRDDDCDGLVDEAGADGEDPVYADADGDGYGDPTTEVLACEATDGWVNDATDCDDADPAVNPAATEVCLNGLDDDCDGSGCTYSAYDAFSDTANPNGDWSWGWSSAVPVTTLTLYNTWAPWDGSSTSLDLWTDASLGSAPNFMRNHTAAAVTVETTVWPAYSVSLHPGPSGEYSVLRWISPVAGDCTINLAFVAYTTTTTEVAVLRNGVVVNSGVVGGAGSVVVSGSFPLAVGDVIDYTVGPGRSYAYDATGIEGGIDCG